MAIVMERKCLRSCCTVSPSPIHCVCGVCILGEQVIIPAVC